MYGGLEIPGHGIFTQKFVFTGKQRDIVLLSDGSCMQLNPKQHAEPIRRPLPGQAGAYCLVHQAQTCPRGQGIVPCVCLSSV